MIARGSRQSGSSRRKADTLPRPGTLSTPCSPSVAARRARASAEFRIFRPVSARVGGRLRVKVANPDYVVGKKPPYAVQPPITHPPFCVCDICPGNRKRAAETQGLSLDEIWSQPLDIRNKRASPQPDSRPKTVAYAQHLITAEPLRLAAAVKAAEEARLAKQNARSFGEIVDAYRAYMQSEGKRYDKAASRINYIERKIGRDRDANTIDLSDLRNLLASVAHLSKQTRRHYGSTFLAMMNNAKADGSSGPTRSGMRAFRPFRRRRRGR